jgi:hypothetical protein
VTPALVRLHLVAQPAQLRENGIASGQRDACAAALA